MISTKTITAAIFLILLNVTGARGQERMSYSVSMQDAGSHIFHIVFRWEGIKGPVADLRMPAWMPGYYQLLHYAEKVEHFRATDNTGRELSWEKTRTNTWRVATGKSPFLVLSYDVNVSTPLPGVPNVAQSWLDSSHAFLAPAGIFLYPEGRIHSPVTVTLRPRSGWSRVATGLDTVAGKRFVYAAPDFDMLYDCPILAGNLEELPSFRVKGVPHYFIGYQLGTFDRQQFMQDLQKVVEAGIAVIGEIPYRHYTFLAIGPGRGGIEHLNSTTVGFSGESLNTTATRQRMLGFLSHEYFHHYNVKRIRPIALGPFDYEAENRTNMLWVSEGLTVYYEYLMVLRAGLMTGDDLLHDLQSNIAAYENKPGHLYQSATQSSYETWSDGPFVKPEVADRTISYYDKGPALGMLLDFAIRHATGNRRSLDDVMRALYRQYYQEKKIGFTDEEFRQVCERIAGAPLPDIFDYASTVKDVDYGKYLAYAGLAIDTSLRESGNKTERSWRITRLAEPDVLQAAIRKDWLKE